MARQRQHRPESVRRRGPPQWLFARCLDVDHIVKDQAAIAVDRANYVIRFARKTGNDDRHLVFNGTFPRSCVDGPLLLVARSDLTAKGSTTASAIPALLLGAARGNALASHYLHLGGRA